MLSKAYIYKWIKTQRHYYCLTMVTCQKNLRASYCLGSIFDYQNPTKQPKSDLLIAVDCITSSMKGLFSRQSANASRLAAFADSRHSRIFCDDFSLLIFYTNLNNNCTFRKSVMIKNKYVWFDQERVGQGSTSPLRDARSLLKERNPALLSVSDVVFSSFNPKSLTAHQSRGEMPGIAGTKRAVREPGSGYNQPAGSWWSWTSSCIRERRP